jgi:hypothetical protein
MVFVIMGKKRKQMLNLSIKTKETAAHYNIPANTIRDWEKTENWRKEHIEFLKDLYTIEKETIKTLKKIFKEDELLTIKAMLNGTILGKEVIEKEFLEFYIEETLLYEPFNIMGEDKKIIVNAIKEKIKKLGYFEKYVLVKICTEDLKDA